MGGIVSKKDGLVGPAATRTSGQKGKKDALAIKRSAKGAKETRKEGMKVVGFVQSSGVVCLATQLVMGAVVGVGRCVRERLRCEVVL